jgi:hypothetical protein
MGFYGFLFLVFVFYMGGLCYVYTQIYLHQSTSTLKYIDTIFKLPYEVIGAIFTLKVIYKVPKKRG